jgi:hypothetical protein
MCPNRGGEYAVRSRPSLPWELYERWFGPDALRKRLREVAGRVVPDTLPERTRVALGTAERYASGQQTNDLDAADDTDID